MYTAWCRALVIYHSATGQRVYLMNGQETWSTYHCTPLHNQDHTIWQFKGLHREPAIVGKIS